MSSELIQLLSQESVLNVVVVKCNHLSFDRLIDYAGIFDQTKSKEVMPRLNKYIEDELNTCVEFVSIPLSQIPEQVEQDSASASQKQQNLIIFKRIVSILCKRNDSKILESRPRKRGINTNVFHKNHMHCLEMIYIENILPFNDQIYQDNENKLGNESYSSDDVESYYDYEHPNLDSFLKPKIIGDCIMFKYQHNNIARGAKFASITLRDLRQFVKSRFFSKCACISADSGSMEKVYYNDTDDLKMRSGMIEICQEKIRVNGFNLVIVYDAASVGALNEICNRFLDERVCGQVSSAVKGDAYVLVQQANGVYENISVKEIVCFLQKMDKIKYEAETYEPSTTNKLAHSQEFDPATQRMLETVRAIVADSLQERCTNVADFLRERCANAANPQADQNQTDIHE